MARQPITTLVRGKRLTLREVSDRYGIAYEAVRERYYRAKKRGEDLFKPSPRVSQTRRHVLTLLEQGLPGVQIARLLGCTP
ncbi:hypothetical protein NS337_00450 [Pseudomonas oryzihabitans]|uniref:hypothetical protein n=1 Tax=Pseudomonas oryzihabitans TaxID=47885 RepID=UPI0007369CC5|nr:hypothetical protein [Pseudomonas psychrotolerans]KTT57149.1 hypothetical protein NS337_00450 [Pseudomonas psychrotolerans]